MERKPSLVDTDAGCGRGDGLRVGPVGLGGRPVGWWRVEGDPELDLDVPSGNPDILDMQAQELLFLGVAEGVDDGVDAGGEVVHAAAELVVASAARSSARLFACAAALLGGRSLR